VKQASGVELRLHDIRSLAVSQMARWQVPEILLDIVLGHSVGKSIVAKNYLSYRFEAEHRVALSRWAEWLGDEQAELTAGAIAQLAERAARG
jgi:intergrase/recombinase